MSHKIINIGKKTFTILFDDLPSRITPEDDEVLKRDIALNGIIVPIIVDVCLRIIDGVRRARIAAELRLKSIPFLIIANLTPQQKRAYAVTVNANRRQWNREEKKQVAVILRKEQFSLNRIADVLAVGTETIRRWLTCSDEKVDLPETVIGKDGIERPATMQRKPIIVARSASEAKSLSDRLLGSDATKHLKGKIIYGTHLDRELNKGREANPPDDISPSLERHNVKLYHGDYREKCASIPDDSIEVLMTDGPYAEGALALFEDLAKLASRVLLPGGLLLSYCGNMYIDSIHRLFGESLQYIWTFGVRHTGGNTPIHSIKVFQSYKPVIAYQKLPKNTYWDPFPDMVSGGKSKLFHKWEQPESEAEYFLKHLCPHMGATLLDPMMGSGSIIMAGLKLGFKCIGVDINGAAYATALQRVERFLNGPKNDNAA